MQRYRKTATTVWSWHQFEYPASDWIWYTSFLTPSKVTCSLPAWRWTNGHLPGIASIDNALEFLTLNWECTQEPCTYNAAYPDTDFSWPILETEDRHGIRQIYKERRPLTIYSSQSRQMGIVMNVNEGIKHLSGQNSAADRLSPDFMAPSFSNATEGYLWAERDHPAIQELCTRQTSSAEE